MSYAFVNGCDHIKNLEKGIFFDPVLLLDQGSKVSKESCTSFQKELDERKPKVEFTILQRICCHKGKYDQLFKSFEREFTEKNMYNDMFPFAFNRVKLFNPEVSSNYSPRSRSFGQ